MHCIVGAQVNHQASGDMPENAGREAALSGLSQNACPISTKNPTDQGLVLNYAFNHGKSAQAMEAAREMARRVDAKAMVQPGMESMQHLYASPLYGMARFGMWDKVLQQPMPAKEALYLRGVWHFARGLAHIRKGNEVVAEMEIKDLDRLQTDPRVKGLMLDGTCPVERVMGISSNILKGELAAKRMKFDEAISYLGVAVALEDEKPYKTYPARLVLGAVLIEAGKPVDAERVYLEELENNPENGWALFGLAQAYEKQGRVEDAAKAKVRFGLAWKDADIQLTSSRK